MQRLTVLLIALSITFIAAEADAAGISYPQEAALRLFKRYLPKIEASNPEALVNTPVAITGDLNGDGLDDVIVYFTMRPKGGGNAIVGREAAIYLQKNGQMKVAGSFPEMDCGFVVDSISSGIVKVLYAECLPPYLTVTDEQEFVFANGTIQAKSEKRKLIPTPPFPTRVSSLKELVPDGWSIEKNTEGDLDGDQSPDAVLVLKQSDPKLIVKNKDGLGVETYDSNPRMIIVATKSGGKSEYKLAGLNSRLIPRWDSPTIDDPLESVSIEKRVIKVRLRSWSSAGSWGASNMTFSFRWQDDCVRLIGYDRNDLHRGSGETKDTSVNFLTSKAKFASGSIEHDKQEIRWGKVSKSKKCLEDVGDGFEFDPES